MQDSQQKRFLVTSAPGLADLLVQELRGLGLNVILERSGAVALTGTWEDAAQILVRSRIASRVFVSIRRFAARNKSMLYDQVRRVHWPEIFSEEKSFAVEAAGTVDAPDLVLSYAPLRIKDAVCDEFRKYGLNRPDVDRHDPEVRLNAYFHHGRCELSMDLAGRPLHRRGYRPEEAEAPLRENRAAALLLFAGYDGSAPLLDPFCGSGTIPIEAALMATRTAPGLLRPLESFALHGLFPEARAELARVYEMAGEERRLGAEHAVEGSDIDAEALSLAGRNAERAGVADVASFHKRSALETPGGFQWIVANPPYGERLETPEAAARLLEEFIHRVKHFCAGSRCAIVLPKSLEGSIRLRAQKRLTLKSGSMNLSFLLYEIHAGKFPTNT